VPRLIVTEPLSVLASSWGLALLLDDRPPTEEPT